MVPSVMRNSSFSFPGNVRSIKVSDSYELSLVGRRRYFLWDYGRKLDRATHIAPLRGLKRRLLLYCSSRAAMIATATFGCLFGHLDERANLYRSGRNHRQ
jgi:hypothetical protein